MKIRRYFKAHCRKPGPHDLTLCGLDAYVTPSVFTVSLFYDTVQLDFIDLNICPMCKKDLPLAMLGELP